MNERARYEQMAAMNAQYAAQLGAQLPPSEPADRLSLPDYVENLVLAERDAEVLRLRTEAEELSKLTASQYVARGLYVHSVSSFELAGRLAKKGWSTLDFDRNGHRWRVNSGSLEYRVDKKDVIEMLTGSSPSGSTEP